MFHISELFGEQKQKKKKKKEKRISQNKNSNKKVNEGGTLNSSIVVRLAGIKFCSIAFYCNFYTG